MVEEKGNISLKDVIECVKPVFDGNCIPVCMSSNNKYAPYLTVALRSILKNSNPTDKYDIVILEKDLSDANKRILKRYESDRVSVRFYNLSDIIDSAGVYFYTFSYFSIEVYFRLFIPCIFKNYEKVLWLDCDAVCMSDIAELYNQDLSDNMIGAVKDIIALNCILSDKYFNRQKEELSFENPTNYVNSGVLLFDIHKLNDFDFVAKSLDLIKHFIPKFPDQDIINKVAEGHIKHLNLKYNSTYYYNSILTDANLNLYRELYQEAKDALENPVFFHFMGPDKPWTDMDLYNASLFWKYARETEVYEKILFHNFQYLFHYRRNLLYYLMYSFLCHFTFGKTYKKLKNKKTEYKKKMKYARQIFKAY